MPFDIVIVGGGLSGLALAAELAHPDFSHLNVLVLEQRSIYGRDRTWSYWRTHASPPHAYSHLERQAWRHWRVRDGECSHQQPATSVPNQDNTASPTSYCTLDADAFYSAALRTIARSSHIELRLDTSVRHLRGGDAPTVEIMNGEVIRATWVFDARPPQHSDANGLVQQFAGLEIKTDSDVFDVTTVELMDFQPNNKGLHFFYVLPYTPRVALVETTWICPASHQPDFDAELRMYIASLVGSTRNDSFEILYAEKGVLSLSPVTPDKLEHVVPLGRGAGTLRASTGYAFLETLVHASQIASSLKNRAKMGNLQHWVPPAFNRPALDLWMDGIFLNVLARDWRKSPGYFMQMFERVDADTLVAFLSGQASFRQRLSVAAALPTWPFAMQALATLAGQTQPTLERHR